MLLCRILDGVVVLMVVLMVIVDDVLGVRVGIVFLMC